MNKDFIIKLEKTNICESYLNVQINFLDENDNFCNFKNTRCQFPNDQTKCSCYRPKFIKGLNKDNLKQILLENIPEKYEEFGYTIKKSFKDREIIVDNIINSIIKKLEQK